MTQQDDITQRVLTAEEILGAIRSAGYRDHPTNIERKRVDAILSAVGPLLSKLRAPVADTLPLEAALHVLVDKIVPGLDTGDLVHDAGRASAVLGAIMAGAPVAGAVRWPTMPPSKGQSPVLFEDGYAEGWAKCMDECQRAVSLASAPVAGEAHTALNEWLDKTDFIQKRIAYGELPVKYLGWHRADVMRDLIDAAARNPVLPSGCIVVQEADTIPHTHPEYGSGIFFTEDARIEFDAAPQASAENVRELPDAEMRTLIGNYFADDWAKEAAAGLLHDYARALKQPQADKDGCTCPSGDGSLRHPCPAHPRADKDGGQQRAGDVDALRFIAGTIYLHLSGPQYAAEVMAAARSIKEWFDCQQRAALSAPQAEQGERDA